MDEDFLDFMDYVYDDRMYLPIPRNYIRDVTNPLEKYCDDELIQRFRFSSRTITNVLLPLVFPNHHFEPRNKRGLPVPPIIKLCTALRYYATGSYQRVCGDLEGISQATASRIIKEVSEALASNLQRYIKFPSDVQFYRNRALFFDNAGFPGLVGCIDGTHIEIKNPGGDRAEVYRNRKTWFSLNIQVVVGPSCEILDIVIRWPGSTHDSRIFNNSSLKLRFEQQELKGFLLGDSGYPQLKYLFTPVINPQTRAEQRYNGSLKTTRSLIERSFGQWKQRFLCLTHMMPYKLRTTTRIIASTAVLHNIAIQEKESFIPIENFRLREVAAAPLGNNPRGNQIRAAFIQRHFNN